MNDPHEPVIAHLRRPREEPQSVRHSGSGWTATTGGHVPARADTIRFVRERFVDDRGLLAVEYEDEEDRSWFMVFGVTRSAAGDWRMTGAAGGGRSEPRSSVPWANLGGWWNDRVACAGGRVHGAGGAGWRPFVGPVGRWVVRRLSGLLVYVVVCAAPPAARVGDFVALAHRRDWGVAVVASPDAVPFLDPAGLERATGHPVRSSWRRPDEPASVPDADAVVVAPATFNTFNKWVAGIADTVATGTVSEYMGRSVPMVVAPCVR